MVATKISMKKSTAAADELLQIDRVYVVGNVYFQTGWYKTDFLHDYLKSNPGSIQVNLRPFPALAPVTGGRNEKYVMSSLDMQNRDSLLGLPRE